MITTSKEEPPFYSATPCKQFDTNDAPHSAYGISYRSKGILTTVDDVSCSGPIASKMAEFFTLCQLPPERLWNAIDILLP